MTDKPRVLVVDVGNTNTKYALFCDDQVHDVCSFKTCDAGVEVARAVEQCMDGPVVDGVCISSVVPACVGIWQQTVRERCGLDALIVNHRLAFGFQLNYPSPETIGVDRLVNACWAVHACASPVIVCDFGTAATFDLVLPESGFAGGVIAPGAQLMLNAMHAGAAQLPSIALSTMPDVVGRSTAEAMQSGAYWGFVGMAQGIIRRIQTTLDPADCTVCLTGGLSAEIAEGLAVPVMLEPCLTLCGVGRAFELNRNVCE